MLGGGASLSYNKCTVQFGGKKKSRRVDGAGARDFIWRRSSFPLHKTRLPTAGSDWWPKRRGTSSWFFRVGWLGRDDIHHHHSKSVTRKRERPRPRPPSTRPQSPLRTLFRHGGNDVKAHVGPFGLADWPTGRRGHALLFGNSPAARRGRAHNRCVGCSLLPLACRFLLMLTLTGDRWKEGLD